MLTSRVLEVEMRGVATLGGVAILAAQPAVCLAAPTAADATRSPHLAQMLAAPPRAARALPPSGMPLPQVTPGPNALVYGYLAYWDDDLYTVPWDQLSHLAIFQADVHADGSLSSTSNFGDAATAVALAEPYGVRIHLCVTNFSSSEISSILDSPTNRGRLLDELRTWVDSTGAHGVNIDFEGLSSSSKANLVTFAEELEAEFGDDVVFATPAVDWGGAWDYSELTKHAYAFIMGYAYHWTGGDPGPNDPLYSSDFWGTYSLEWTIGDYLTYGADPDRVILGLPLYGQGWATADSARGADGIGNGWPVFFDDAWVEVDSYGRQWDADSATPWYYDGYNQVWYGDVDSVEQRITHALDSGLAGVGFWALHYDGDDPAMWAMIDALTTTDATGPGDTGDTTDTGDTGDTVDTEDTGPGSDPGVISADDLAANAGSPFLAYVGDTVVLSAAGSSGPPGVALSYAWEQVAGPAVALDDPTAEQPSFAVAEPGTTAFELTVSAYGVSSAPATSYVVVLDTAAGRRHAATGCGCGALGVPFGAWPVALGGLVLVLRRRRSSVSAR
jgi:spore germination protein YaaH